jgi:hypothetical protein
MNIAASSLVNNLFNTLTVMLNLVIFLKVDKNQEAFIKFFDLYCKA